MTFYRFPDRPRRFDREMTNYCVVYLLVSSDSADICPDVKRILQYEIYQINPEQPATLPSLKLAIVIHEDKDPEGVKD